jgi:DNA-binding cell septation regulator SpoVG
MIYGCRFVEGKNGDFVSFPSYKGSDGKYYSHAYIKLDEADVMLIDEQIDQLLAD